MTQYPYITKYLYRSDIDNTMLFNQPLEKILTSHTVQSSSDIEYSSTSVMLPQVIRIALSLLKEKQDLSMRYVIEQAVKQGFSIIQYKYNDLISIVKDARLELDFPVMSPIRNFLYDLKIDVDGVTKSSRRHITIDTNILNGIRDIAHSLNIEQSSMIRLCLYFSFATSYSSSSEVIKASKKEIDSFEQCLTQQLLLLPVLVKADKDYKEFLENGIDLLNIKR